MARLVVKKHVPFSIFHCTHIGNLPFFRTPFYSFSSTHVFVPPSALKIPKILLESDSEEEPDMIIQIPTNKVRLFVDNAPPCKPCCRAHATVAYPSFSINSILYIRTHVYKDTLMCLACLHLPPPSYQALGGTLLQNYKRILVHYQYSGLSHALELSLACRSYPFPGQGGRRLVL